MYGIGTNIERFKMIPSPNGQGGWKNLIVCLSKSSNAALLKYYIISVGLAYKILYEKIINF